MSSTEDIAALKLSDTQFSVGTITSATGDEKDNTPLSPLPIPDNRHEERGGEGRESEARPFNDDQLPEFEACTSLLKSKSWTPGSRKDSLEQDKRIRDLLEENQNLHMQKQQLVGLKFAYCIIYQAPLKNESWGRIFHDSAWIWFFFAFSLQLFIAYVTKDFFWVTLSFLILKLLYGIWIAMKGPTRDVVHYAVHLFDNYQQEHMLEVTNPSDGKPTVKYWPPEECMKLYVEEEGRGRFMSMNSAHHKRCSSLLPAQRNSTLPNKSMKLDILGLCDHAVMETMKLTNAMNLTVMKQNSSQVEDGIRVTRSGRKFEPVFITRHTGKEFLKNEDTNATADREGVLAVQILALFGRYSRYAALRGNCQTFAAEIAQLFMAEQFLDRLLPVPGSDAYYKFAHRRDLVEMCPWTSIENTTSLFSLFRIVAYILLAGLYWVTIEITGLGHPTIECENGNIRKCNMTTYCMISGILFIICHCISRIFVAGSKYVFIGELSGSEQMIADRIGLFREACKIKRTTKKNGKVTWDEMKHEKAQYMCCRRKTHCLCYALGMIFIINAWFMIFFLPLFVPLLVLKYDTWGAGTLLLVSAIVMSCATLLCCLAQRYSAVDDVADGGIKRESSKPGEISEIAKKKGPALDTRTQHTELEMQIREKVADDDNKTEEVADDDAETQNHESITLTEKIDHAAGTPV